MLFAAALWLCTYCFLFVLEPVTSPSGELPVTIEHQQDATVSNNLTRNDANCDKTGTCYDGNWLFTSSRLNALRDVGFIYEFCSSGGAV